MASYTQLGLDDKEYLTKLINFTVKKETEINKRSAVILTTNPANGETNATVVLMIDENRDLYLFNSHGQTYHDEAKKEYTRGASLIKFSDINSLTTYIKKFLFKEKPGNIQFRPLTIGLNN